MRDQFAPVRRRSAARHSPFIWARRVLIVVALGATIYIVVPQLADLGQAAAALAHVQPFHIVGGLLLEALSYLSVAQLYRTILADVGAPISLGVAIETTMAVQAVTHIVPMERQRGCLLTWT